MLEFDDQYYMDMAIRAAMQAASKDEVPVGCVIVHNETVIAKAHNLCETLTDPTAHAEMLAITQATEALGRQRLEDAVVYVTVEPCPMCATALLLARVGRLVFATPDEKMGGTISKYQIPTDKKLNHVIDVSYGVMADEARDLMQSFFRAKRQKP